MKKMNFLLLTVPLFLFAGCSKTNSSTAPPPNTDADGIALSTGTLSKVITIDNSSSTYKYLWLSFGTSYVYRTDIDKTYSLAQLAIDKDCKWKIEMPLPLVVVGAGGSGGGSSSLDNEKVVFRSGKYPTEYWGVAKGGTVGGNEEWMLTTLHYSAKPDPTPDYLKFILHKVADQNGVHAYTIESVFKPGYYLHNTGHTILANGVGLINHATSSLPLTVFEFH